MMYAGSRQTSVQAILSGLGYLPVFAFKNILFSRSYRLFVQPHFTLSFHGCILPKKPKVYLTRETKEHICYFFGKKTLPNPPW